MVRGGTAASVGATAGEPAGEEQEAALPEGGTDGNLFSDWASLNLESLYCDGKNGKGVALGPDGGGAPCRRVLSLVVEAVFGPVSLAARPA